MASPHPASLLLVCALVIAGGCGDKDVTDPDDTSNPDGPASRAVVEIVSPSHGDSFTQGESVALEVTVTNEDSGEPMDYDSVSWSAEGWSYDQAAGSVDDLPVGSYNLGVEVVIGGRSITDEVTITVEERHDPINYRGDLRSTIYLYSNEYDLDDEGPCNGTFDLTTDEQYIVAGTGQCDIELFWGMVDWDVIFQIDGARRGGTVEGTLFFFDDHGTRYEQPYTGTISDTELSVSFDAEHSNADGILAFSGTMEGQAVP